MASQSEVTGQLEMYMICVFLYRGTYALGLDVINCWRSQKGINSQLWSRTGDIVLIITRD